MGSSRWSVQTARTGHMSVLRGTCLPWLSCPGIGSAASRGHYCTVVFTNGPSILAQAVRMLFLELVVGNVTHDCNMHRPTCTRPSGHHEQDAAVAHISGQSQMRHHLLISITVHRVAVDFPCLYQSSDMPEPVSQGRDVFSRAATGFVAWVTSGVAYGAVMLTGACLIPSA